MAIRQLAAADIIGRCRPSPLSPVTPASRALTGALPQAIIPRMTSTTSVQVDIYEVASHLWETADEPRANSHPRRRNTRFPSSASSSSSSPIAASPRPRPRSPAGAAAVAGSARPTTRAAACSTCRTTPASRTFSSSPRARTSARRSTTPWPPSRTKTRSSPASCLGHTRSSATTRSSGCSDR
jgi:hypothetical protein